MEKRIGLRAKAHLLIIPLVVVVVLVSGALASLESRSALTGIATRLMAYKAEQLRSYAHSEWEMINELELDQEQHYRDVVEASIRNYAASLLRRETERIIAVDSEGDIAMNVGVQGEQDDTGSTETPADSPSLSSGWFEDDLLGERRVGVAFKFEPFGWTIGVTELEDSFFSEVRHIQGTHGAILLVSVLVMVVLVSVFVGFVIRPMERLTATIRGVAGSHDLSQRVTIEFADEVGVLANEFNTMIETLEENYEQLTEKTRAETQAREEAHEREQETLLLLGRASEYRDQDTARHLDRVGELSALLARLHGEDQYKQQLIRQASQLHDIGKIATPDSILLKPGSLDPREYEQMQQHPIQGYQLLKDSKSIFLIEGANIALTHHERWDGTGYPNRLSGEEIPISGRIVGLVDAFDALTSTRPYKGASAPEDARESIVEERGKHFDPTLVDLFQANFPLFKKAIERD